MGLLSQDYYDNLRKKREAERVAAVETAVQQKPLAQPNPTTPPVQNSGGGVPQISAGERLENKLLDPLEKAGQARLNALDRGVTIKDNQEVPTAMLTPEEQTAKFGGVVGSQEWLDYQANRSFVSRLPTAMAETLGVKFPKQSTWDKMTAAEKSRYTFEAASDAGSKFLIRAPRETLKAPIRALYSVGSMIKGGFTDAVELATGKPFDVQKRGAQQEELQVPLIGAIPSYNKSYDDARKSGMGTFGALLSTVSTAAGDATMSASLVEALKTGLVRPKITKGQVINDVAPVRQALAQGEKAMPKPIISPGQSPHEYYSLPKTVAKNMGGGPGDTYLKITPADIFSDNPQLEISVVQTRGGVLQKTRDYFSPKGEKYEGDFGPEIKLQSQRIPLDQSGAPLPPELEAVFGKRLSTEGTIENVPTSIPPAPLKGMENKPITNDQMLNLRNVVGKNNIEGDTANAMMRVITGKNSVGDLTQAEYVNLVQTMGVYSTAGRYVGKMPTINPFSQFLSPQRHWMRSYEEKSGIPLYSKVYTPMEDAVRLRDVFRENYRTKSREVFGDYASPKFMNERRLLKAHMEGDSSAITNNPDLTPKVKSDLETIAAKLRPMYDELGTHFGLPTDKFLQNYQPHIKNIGGVYMLYKDAAEDITNHLSFFGDYKRNGALTEQVDDALALFDIYTNAGSNKMFMNPALESAAKLGDSLPETLKNSVKSYVGEKLGYAGRMEQYLNDLGPDLGRKFGLDLPPDLGRKMTKVMMDTSYSGTLGLRPGAVVRNYLQNPLLTYPRLGPKFYKEAVAKAMTAEGKMELMKKGFLMDKGVPHGYDLLKDPTLTSKVGSAYDKVTQATLKPFSSADAFTRTATYWQTKYQWQDAIGKLNEGKMNWQQFEKAVDFDALSPVDRNIIRKRIVDGDQEGAFDHLVRDVIDETQFPYRKGASSRITYGLGGKIGTQFAQWNIEFAHTMKRWVATKQWDKIIRFHAAASATSRTMKDLFGFDVGKWVNPQDSSVTPAPAVQFGTELAQLITSLQNDDDQAYEEHKDAIIKQILTMGIPAGLQGQRVMEFKKSVEKGPDAEGLYPIYSAGGKLKTKAPFKDVFWKAMGFPSARLVEEDNLNKEMISAKFNYSQAKRKVLELYQQEKYDAANELIAEHNISITPQDFQAYYIPTTRRTYNSLPAGLKARFADQVFK